MDAAVNLLLSSIDFSTKVNTTLRNPLKWYDDIVSCANLSPDMIGTTSTVIYKQCNMLFLRTYIINMSLVTTSHVVSNMCNLIVFFFIHTNK